MNRKSFAESIAERLSYEIEDYLESELQRLVRFTKTQGDRIAELERDLEESKEREAV